MIPSCSPLANSSLCFPEFRTHRSYRPSLSGSSSPQSHPGIPAIAIEFVIRIVKLHNVPDFFENPDRLKKENGIKNIAEASCFLPAQWNKSQGFRRIRLTCSGHGWRKASFAVMRLLGLNLGIQVQCFGGI